MWKQWGKAVVGGVAVLGYVALVAANIAAGNWATVAALGLAAGAWQL